MDYVNDQLTLPDAYALSRYWQTILPTDLQLRRIAQYLGVPDVKPPERPSKPAPAQDLLRDALAAGLPVMEGRPDDPMLDLLDL